MSESEWDAGDKQIKRDLQEGRLDKFINQAEEEHKRGLTLSFAEGYRAYQHMLDQKQNQPQ